MKKIEVHTKTKYSMDYDSTIDVETVLWNSLESGEEGIIFIDKDSNYSFPKIEKAYKNLCEFDSRFSNYKIGYGVQLTTIINNKKYEVNILLKNNSGIVDLNELISIYLDKKIIQFDKINNLRKNLIIGIILNDNDNNLDLSLFDYIEVNDKVNINNFKDKLVVYSNIPNALFEGEIKAKHVLYQYRHIKENPTCRLYLDTEDTLKTFNNEKIIINNSHKLLDMLDNITINDHRFYTTKADFDKFKNMVYEKFKIKFKNPSNNTIKRLDNELNLIKELNYTYFYEMTLDITNFIKNNNEYYQIDNFLNNSLVAFTLDITNIEPFNLPYELFFSETPNLILKVSDEFYSKKLFKYIMDNINLIRCNHGHKINKDNIFRIIKHYEILTKNELSLSEKDYISEVLADIPIYRDTAYNNFYVIPKYMDHLNFTPLNNYGTIIDYHDLSDNLINVQIVTSSDINYINKFKQDNILPKFCNDKKVLNLYRSTESFNVDFKILGYKNGLGFIDKFDYNVPNICFDDLVNISAKNYKKVIIDDVFNNFKNQGMDDLNSFLALNSLKNVISFIPKANIINNIKNTYLFMYYKLYYPKVFYESILNNYDEELIKLKNISMDEIIKDYQNELSINNTNIVYELLIEMYERNIKFKIINNKIEIGE